MPADVMPYMVPGTGTVSMTPWRWAVDDGWEVLPEVLPDWDPSMVVRMQRVMTVDLDRLVDETGIDRRSHLVVTFSWASSTSGMRGAAPRVHLDSSGTALIEVTLPGDRIGGILDLRTTLTVQEISGPITVGVARLPGSVLFEDRQRLDLENVSGRFPVHQIDFASTRLDPRASWHLETTTDLSAPFLGSFLLLINTRDVELTKAVSRGRKDSRQEALLEELEHGVGVLLVELAALLRTEMAERADWPAGSVGDVLAETLRRAERDGVVPAPTGAHVLSQVRTRFTGAVRSMGRGRQFR